MSASRPLPHIWSYLFFFNDTATTEIYTLTLHDALPISETDRVISHDDRRHPTEAPECGFGSVPPGKVCVPVLALERDADVQHVGEPAREVVGERDPGHSCSVTLDATGPSPGASGSAGPSPQRSRS